MLSKTGSISQVFKQKFICFSSPFARFISGVLVLKTTPKALFKTLYVFRSRLSWRSNSIPFFRDKTLQRRERNENTEHLPATFALKPMLTRYNFGAARDPEMLHKIYNAEPVAPIIEIPRREICMWFGYNPQIIFYHFFR